MMSISGSNDEYKWVRGAIPGLLLSIKLSPRMMKE